MLVWKSGAYSTSDSVITLAVPVSGFLPVNLTVPVPYDMLEASPVASEASSGVKLMNLDLSLQTCILAPESRIHLLRISGLCFTFGGSDLLGVVVLPIGSPLLARACMTVEKLSAGAPTCS